MFAKMSKSITDMLKCMKKVLEDYDNSSVSEMDAPILKKFENDDLFTISCTPSNTSAYCHTIGLYTSEEVAKKHIPISNSSFDPANNCTWQYSVKIATIKERKHRIACLDQVPVPHVFSLNSQFPYCEAKGIWL
jgi:hypothetical protein